MEKSQIQIHEPYTVKGLINLGNCCFLNSAMQLIRAISPLVQIANQSSHTNCLNSIDSVAKTKTGRILEPNTSFWRVVELYLGYSPRAIRQNCACEFLRFFLVNLDEELEGRFERNATEDPEWVEVTNRNVNQRFNFRARGKSVVYDVVGMTFKVQARAKGESSMTYQEELVVSVQVENSLAESLDKFFGEGLVEEFMVNGVPSRCKTRTFVAAYSPYLIFHIQRFKVENGRVFKVKKFVSFPKNLKIPSKYLTPSLALGVENGSCLKPEYELKAIVEHHGENANGGHYTCVIHSESGWVQVDDHIVRPVSAEFVRNRCAYILMYEQVNRASL